LAQLQLSVQNLRKRFGGNRVFNDITLTHKGGVMGIAGANGSGKSTLLQCFARLVRPTSGQVEWYKKEQQIDVQKITNHLGYAAPYINLYEELSCSENLEFLLQLRNTTDVPAAVQAALARTEIQNLGDQLFGKLSTGQQQRMRLAAAIVHQPKVLFLDEPGSNLDEKGRMLIESLVAEFKEVDKLVIIASNNPDELALCNRVYSVEEERFLK
jgi:ABC-type multidrug transport system ATPase subunit